MFIIELKDFNGLLGALHARGYSTIAPVLRDGAIVLDAIQSTSELPVGWREQQAPASYTLGPDEGKTLFNHGPGPQSWKRFLYPPKRKLFSLRRNGKSFDVETNHSEPTPRLAFIGIRPCDLNALKIVDQVFHHSGFQDSHYAAAREGLFVVAVNCTDPGANCFCASMMTGPRADAAFDLALTEIEQGTEHYFLVEVGSERGAGLLTEVHHREATRQEIEAAILTMAKAADGISKSLNTKNLAQSLTDNYEHPHWDDIAKRCLACANCTMVCPTCFCSTVEDATDLKGENAERWRRWDSCFTADFTKIAGGNIRMSTRTRYRQWLMHKLSYWHEQFGTSGCVGCGRCITWCPAGIDITKEASIIRETGTQLSTM